MAQDLRDRIALTTPLTRTTLKGWLIQHDVQLDLATREVTGYIRFYDQNGAIVESRAVRGRVTKNKRDAFVADLISDIVAQDPTLAGIATVESVDDSTSSPVVNP